MVYFNRGGTEYDTLNASNIFVAWYGGTPKVRYPKKKTPPFLGKTLTLMSEKHTLSTFFVDMGA